MDSFSTPVARRGPTSRLLQRRSTQPPPASPFQKVDEVLRSPTMSMSMNMTSVMESSLFQKNTRHSFKRPMDMAEVTMAGQADITVPYDITALNTTKFNLKAADVLTEDNPGLKATEDLYVDFLASCHPPVHGSKTLDQVAEFEQLVSDHTDVLRNVIADIPSAKNKYPKSLKMLHVLTKERNTWRLLGKLYHDRLNQVEYDMDEDLRVITHSEKRVIERFFRREGKMREAQGVIDWLELNAKDQLDELYSKIEYFSDSTVGWENTLSALQRKTSTRQMVSEMDPDAPRRQGKPLHDLDMQDQNILLKTLYTCIRSGSLDVAQDLCVRIGQPWRAATLEGWKLFHDPNYENDSQIGEKMPVEGNKTRDVWKKVAWRLTKDEKMGQYERAIYSALCGNISQLLTVCSTWEDCLWAYARCMVDVRVETEIRDHMQRPYAQLPQEFWDNKQTMTDILDAIESMDITPEEFDIQVYYIIQSCLILGDWSRLMNKMSEWIRSPIQPHFLRLLAHIVIVFRRIGTNSGFEEKENEVLEAYVAFLMSADKVQQVAWYTSQLPRPKQIEMYAKFLEDIANPDDRRLCLTLANESDLPIHEITVRVVESIRTAEEASDGDEFRTETSEHDLGKIDALSWLIFDEAQRDEAIFQANALIRSLIAAGKTSAAKIAWEKIPSDSVDLVTQQHAELSHKQQCSIREYLCFQYYLDGHEAFSDWFGHFHKGQPKKPVLPEKATFTEQVAYEQKEKQFQVEMERWNGAQLIQSRSAEQRLRRILTFPHGWLVDLQEVEEAMDEADSEDVQRNEELEYLRRICLPQIVLLLHQVLHSTRQYHKAIQLSDLVAAEQHSLYHVYDKDGMREFLEKVRESSVASLDSGHCDAWGYKKE